MSWTWLTSLLGKENVATKAIDVLDNLTDKIPDGNSRLEIQMAFQELLTGMGSKIMEMQKHVLDLQAQVLTVEMKGNWLQRSWRPILMFIFAGLLVSRWLGFSTEIPKEVELELMSIIKIGLGGYVIGRSGEKIVKELNFGQVLKKK